MSTPTVYLLNPDISSGVPMSYVQGRSGRKWARSRFERQLGRLGVKGITHGHVARMTLAEYHACIADVALESRHRGPRWIACFVEEKPKESVSDDPNATPAAVQNYGLAYGMAIRGEPLFGHPTAASLAGYEQGLADVAASQTHPLAGDPFEKQSELQIPSDALSLSSKIVETKVLLETAVQNDPMKDATQEADGLAKAPFFKLRALAKTEGADITGLKGVKAIVQAIRLHRTQLAGV